MKYGEHSKDVEEVIDFVRRGRLLVPESSCESNYKLLRSFTEAKRTAKCQSSEELPWGDLTEQQLAKILGAGYEIERFDEIRNNLLQLTKMFYGYLKRRLKRQYWEVIDDILFDMRACADNRAAFGKTDNFYEEVFQIYRAGGWPCGWVGRLPDGVFAVYVPTAEFDRIGKGQ